METWKSALVCTVYVNLLINLVSGLAIPRCVQGWLDIPDENLTVITCHDMSRADTVKWTLQNEAENQAIFDGLCGSAIALCRSNNNDMYLERRSTSETSLYIVKNHWNYGGLRLTCSTKTETASCMTNVIHSAELSSCRTEISLVSWQLTVTCNVDNFFSSNKPARCEVIQRVEGKTQRFDCFLVLHNCTDQPNLQIYQKGSCSCTIDLPDVIGNYFYIMNVLPGAAKETAGEVRIDKSEADCTIFMKESPGGSCTCYQRDPGSSSSTPETAETARYVCNLVRGSTSQTGGPINNICQTPYPPRSPPIIKDNENGLILIVGRNITMTCTVSGGKPLVSSIIFVCGNKTGTPDLGDDESVSSSINFQVQVHHNNTLCECSAIWQRKPDLYLDKAYTMLYVKEMTLSATEAETEEKTTLLSQTTFGTQVTKLQGLGSSSSNKDKLLLPVLVGVGAAFVLIIIIAITCVIKVKRSRTYSFL